MRIWVARAEPAGSRTAKRLVELGHDPLLAPILVIAGTGTPPPPGPFDAVLVTSAKAIAPLVAAGLAGVPIFAVGRRTADAARAGGCVSVVAADGDAAALAASVREHVTAGASLLHAAGADRKPEPAARLREAGYRVDVWTAYAAKAVARLPHAVKAALAGEAAALDAVLHYSRRSAELALSLTRSAGLEGAFGRTAHLCLSQDVAAPLVEAGIAAHFVPDRPDEDRLLAGLLRST